MKSSGVHLALLALVPGLFAGCSATTESRKPAHLEIQEEVGFVITEEARITNVARADYEEAVRLLQQERIDEGIELLQKVTDEAPQLSAPWIDLGIAYHRSGDFELAEEQLQKALELNPDHPAVLNELGIVSRKTGRFAEARKYYEAALAVYPGFHYARRNLAVLCDLYLADMDCALQQYNAYVATAPDDEEAGMWLADLQNRMDQ